MSIPIYKADKVNGTGEAKGYLVPKKYVVEIETENDIELDETVKFFILSGMTNHNTEDEEFFHFENDCEIDIETLKISFDNGKSFIKVSELETHQCTDFELKYMDMKMRNKAISQPPNGSIFTVIADKGR